MKIQLGRSVHAYVLVDPEDAHLVALSSGYYFQVQQRHTPNYERYYVKARRRVGDQGAPYLHRLIMGAKPGQHVDHRDGDGRNNQRANLRFADRSTNMANQRRPAGISGFRGVVQSNGDCNAWTARVCVNGKNVYSCGHASPQEAARARDKMAIEHFGEHAVLNFPKKGRKQALNPFQITRQAEAISEQV